MPNSLSALGLELATREEWVAFFTEKYQDIYGADINLASDSPDGQMMNINVQVILDLQDLLLQIYNSFDPDNAIGVVLDQRIAINGIQRQAGTFTVTPITVVTSQSVNLYGLDQDEQDVFTISDNVGTLWQLQTTQLGLGPGTDVLNFQAAEPGAQLTTPNTINVPVTIVLGVTSVNNPTTYTTLGINEETDAVVKVRRQRSVSLASQGYLAGLLAALENINGVTSAFVYENTGDTVDSDGVPGHSIWVIVAGTGAAADIAQAIYTKRNAGCGMKGDIEYIITQVDGSYFTVYWDDVETETLYVKFTVTSIDGVTAPNITAIREGVAAGLSPGVNETVNINALATLVQEIDPNTLVTNAGFSSGALQFLTLSGVAASGTFKISYNGNDSAAINWNDSIGTIETKVQAITGLEDAIVVGSIASQSLSFSLVNIGDVLSLLTVVDNTLQTSAPAAITFSYDAGYQSLFSPTSKRYQFVLSEENVIILSMQLTPSSSSVLASGSLQLTALGGYGDYTYSFQNNNSGGSINASTGLYTAGAATGVTDTLKATDAFGNTAVASVAVV
jgi:hypothetical protein